MNHTENRWNPAARPVAPTAEAEASPPNGPEQAALGEPEQAVGPLSGQETSEEIPDAPAARRHPTLGQELHAILGAGTALDGALSFSGRVRIDGQLDGSATGGDLLVIGAEARVRGQLRAKRVIVLGGQVDADIVASESIELYIPAVVRGDLKSPQIYMDRGIQFYGTCDMTLDPPAVELRPEGDEAE